MIYDVKNDSCSSKSCEPAILPYHPTEFNISYETMPTRKTEKF